MPQDFSGKNLQGRSFKGLDLTGANFSHSDIRGADFTFLRQEAPVRAGGGFIEP